MILPIVQVGEEILTQVANPVEDIHQIQTLIEDMKETLVSTSGRKPLDFSRRLQ